VENREYRFIYSMKWTLILTVSSMRLDLISLSFSSFTSITARAAELFSSHIIHFIASLDGLQGREKGDRQSAARGK
jgi:hypothetical protein